MCVTPVNTKVLYINLIMQTNDIPLNLIEGGASLLLKIGSSFLYRIIFPVYL